MTQYGGQRFISFRGLGGVFGNFHSPFRRWVEHFTQEITRNRFWLYFREKVICSRSFISINWDIIVMI